MSSIQSNTPNTIYCNKYASIPYASIPLVQRVDDASPKEKSNAIPAIPVIVVNSGKAFSELALEVSTHQSKISAVVGFCKKKFASPQEKTGEYKLLTELKSTLKVYRNSAEKAQGKQKQLLHKVFCSLQQTVLNFQTALNHIPFEHTRPEEISYAYLRRNDPFQSSLDKAAYHMQTKIREASLYDRHILTKETLLASLNSLSELNKRNISNKLEVPTLELFAPLFNTIEDTFSPTKQQKALERCSESLHLAQETVGSLLEISAPQLLEPHEEGADGPPTSPS